MKKTIESQTVVALPAVSLVPTAEPALGLNMVLSRINAMAKRRGTRYSVHVLARYWYELEEIKAAHRDPTPGLEEIKFSTVHAAKGLEADFVVVVVGLEAGRDGFPADKAIMDRTDLEETEKLAIVHVRLAQRLFRGRLAAARRSCYLTGVTNRDYLRASHIKPWRDCDDREKQDPNNGLLLAPHVDLLFDQGYLSFEDDGTVLVSRQLDRTVLEAWGLDPTRKGTAFSVEQAKYLAHHRKHVFEKRKG